MNSSSSWYIWKYKRMNIAICLCLGNNFVLFINSRQHHLLFSQLNINSSRVIDLTLPSRERPVLLGEKENGISILIIIFLSCILPSSCCM